MPGNHVDVGMVDGLAGGGADVHANCEAVELLVLLKHGLHLRDKAPEVGLLL